MLLEDLSQFSAKSSAEQDQTMLLSYEEQEIERLCEEERYQALVNNDSNGSDEDYEGTVLLDFLVNVSK